MVNEKRPKIFIIVLNYNGGDMLFDCLDSLYKLKYSNKEIVVVDNDSDDNSFEKVRQKFPNFHFIKNSYNLGFGAGNNVAIKWALEKGADYIFLLNNDAIIERDALSKLLNFMERNKETGIVSPLIYNGFGNKIWFAGGKINWFKMRTEHLNFFDKQTANDKKENDSFVEPRPTEYVTGCAMLIRKKVFSEIGLFDEDFFLYYEDADFSYRARKKGFELFVFPGATVYHFERSSVNPDKIYWLVLSGVLFFEKNSPWYLKLWIKTYLLLRKLKNKYDLKTEKNEYALMIRKAYVDSIKILKNED